MTTARKYVGIKAGSASHKRILAIYNGHKPLARSYAVKVSDNWCATFVSAIMIEAGAASLTGTECSVGEYVKQFQTHGIWNENGAITPKVGDIIVYDWSGTDTWPDHIGFVNAVAGGKITALEGNHNGGVNYRVIAVGDKTIRGYARPKYSAAKAPAKAAAKPAAKPAAKNTTSTKLAVDGDWGAATTKRLQVIYKTTADGIVSSQYPWTCFKGAVTGFKYEKVNPAGSLLIAAIQRSMGLKADGLLGPDTIKAMQRKAGTPVDGSISVHSQLVMYMQRQLNAGRKPF